MLYTVTNVVKKKCSREHVEIKSTRNIILKFTNHESESGLC